MKLSKKYDEILNISEQIYIKNKSNLKNGGTLTLRPILNDYIYIPLSLEIKEYYENNEEITLDIEILKIKTFFKKLFSFPITFKLSIKRYKHEK